MLKDAGKKPGLMTIKYNGFVKELMKGRNLQDGLSVFYAKDIKCIIKKQFGIDYHPHSVQRLLKKLGYSYVSSRPEHPKGDPKAREDFKKSL